jgi:hypothetical protein
MGECIEHGYFKKAGKGYGKRHVTEMRKYATSTP